MSEDSTYCPCSAHRKESPVLSSLISAFIMWLIFLLIMQLVGFDMVRDTDVRFPAMLMAIFCVVLWVLQGFGIGSFFSELGTWLGFMGAVLLVRLLERLLNPSR